MPLTNISNITETVPQMFDSCPLLGPFAWRDEYLTHAVYIQLVISITINGLTFPFTAFFNGCLIFYIIREPTLRQKKSNVLIGYQAVTDLAVGVVAQPLFIATQLCRITGQCRTCAVDSAFYYVAIVTCGSSIHHLILIAWERYVAIKHALRYRLIVTTNRLLAGTITAWLVEIIFTVIFFVGIRQPLINDIIVVVVLLICFSIIAYFYTAIYLESRRHRNQIIKATTLQHGMNLSRKMEFKAAKTTALVVGCLLTCYAPALAVLITMHFIFSITSSNASLWVCIFSWKNTFFLLNSLFNPLIYGWRIHEIREIMARTFKWTTKSVRNEPQTDMIEMVELNRKRVNLRFVTEAEEFVSGGFASDPSPRRNPSKATELITETSIDSNVEANGERGCASKLQLTAHTSPTDEVERTNPNHNVWDDADSESDFELNERFSEGQESKLKERNQITVTAIVHFNPVTNHAPSI